MKGAEKFCYFHIDTQDKHVDLLLDFCFNLYNEFNISKDLCKALLNVVLKAKKRLEVSLVGAAAGLCTCFWVKYMYCEAVLCRLSDAEGSPPVTRCSPTRKFVFGDIFRSLVIFHSLV